MGFKSWVKVVLCMTTVALVHPADRAAAAEMRSVPTGEALLVTGGSPGERKKCSDPKLFVGCEAGQEEIVLDYKICKRVTAGTYKTCDHHAWARNNNCTLEEEVYDPNLPEPKIKQLELAEHYKVCSKERSTLVPMDIPCSGAMTVWPFMWEEYDADFKSKCTDIYEPESPDLYNAGM